MCRSNNTCGRWTALVHLGLILALSSCGGSGGDRIEQPPAPVNHAPVAEAGADQNVSVGDLVHFDGAASSDSDGNTLTYSWSVPTRPTGSTAELVDPASVTPSLAIDVVGNYVVQLIVSDGKLQSVPDTARVITINTPPVANAGTDRTIALNADVVLDGSASTDIDGDLLSYTWTLSAPVGSITSLSDPSSVQPSFSANVPGTYTARLLVHDGIADSTPDTVVIDTLNSAPVANAGPDQTVAVGSLVQLDGTDSSDADADELSFRWSLMSAPTGSLATLSNSFIDNPGFVADVAGEYEIHLTVSDGLQDSDADIAIVSTENSAPVARAGDNVTAPVGRTVTLDGSASADVDDDPITYFWSLLSRPTGSVAELAGETTPGPTLTSDTVGLYIAQLIVNDGTIGSAPDTVTVFADTDTDGDGLTDSEEIELGTDPNSADSDGDGLSDGEEVQSFHTDPLDADTDDDGLSDGDEIDVHSTDPTDADTDNDGLNDGDEVSTYGTLPTNPDTDGDTYADGVEITAGSDPLDNQSVPPVSLPPDPASVAPPIDPTIASTMDKAAGFLIEGPNPVQRGVNPNTIEPKRAAVIRGKVMDRDGIPLPGVIIGIQGHPEFGGTVSRADGMFDMLVNGGGPLVIEYDKNGYLGAQRRLDVEWQRWAHAPDVALVGLDPNVTVIDLPSLTETVVASGAIETDADGSRQARLMFRPGTSATMVMPDGSTQPLTTLSVRATEYTVGPNGLEAMPGELPLMSGYTYAVELSADEAIAAGATSIIFSQGVPLYVDNFIGFPVGESVPIGSYDRAAAEWVGMPNGRVIGIVAITGGLADIDADGDSAPDTPAQLAELGIDDAERAQLASGYSAGQTLWRAVATHFTPFDLNWSYAIPVDATRPEVEATPADVAQKTNDPCEAAGSIIECENQVLGERLEIVGVPHTLNYRSDRVPGASITLDIPVTESVISPRMITAAVIVEVAGHVTSRRYNATPNLTFNFEWDGRDVYGRRMTGTQYASITIQYRYPLIYNSSRTEVISSWARAGGAQLDPERERTAQAVILSKTYTVPLQLMDARGWGMGGWTLDAHHLYDPISRTLFLGNGDIRTADGVGRVVTTVAGDLYQQNYATFPIPALDAAIDSAPGMDFGPDGSLYYVSQGHRSVFRMDVDGIVRRFAGTGEFCGGTPIECGAGGPALEASFGINLSDVAVAPDGTVYVLQEGDYVYAVGTDGILRHVAGWYDDSCRINSTDTFRDCALEGIATERYMSPWGIDVGPDGALYVADLGRASTIGRVDADGIIATVAGTITQADWDTARSCGLEGTPVNQACLLPRDVAVGPDGTIYVLDESQIAVSPLGRNEKVTRVLAFGPDGLLRVVFDERSVDPTLELRAYRLAVDQQGMLYLPAQYGTYSVYMIDPATKQVVAIAGTGARTVCPQSPCGSADDLPARATSLFDPKGIAAGPDGAIYVNDYVRIRRIDTPLPQYGSFNIVIPGDNGAIYEFDSNGRHLRTLISLTGETAIEFNYDDSGGVVQVRYEQGAVDSLSTVERDASGLATGIVGPFGQRTELTYDPDGLLASIRNPSDETFAFSYQSGLLTRVVNPAGGESIYGYDNKRQLISAQDPAGGVQSLVSVRNADLTEVTLTSTGGRTSRYRVERGVDESIRRVTTDAFGAETVTLLEPSGRSTTTYPNGEVVIVQSGGDTQFGQLSEYASSETFLSPGGLTTAVTRTRTTVLADPSSPFSLTSRLDQVDINGRVFASQLDVPSRTFTSTSAEGRIATQSYDLLGRLIEERVDPAISPKQAIYGEQGLISRTTFGPQSLDFAYDALGRVASKTDALAATTLFEYDTANRISALVLPSGRRYEYAYDALGNRTSITMPSGAVHSLGYTVLGQETTYLPPGNPAPLTSEYDGDRKYSATEYPSGRRVLYIKDGTGRATGISYPEADISATYVDLVTERAASMTRTPSEGGAGETIDFTYDGSIITGYSVSGTANAAYSFRYDGNLFLTGLTLDGEPEISVTSDQDGLVTGIGPYTFARQGAGGSPSQITDGTMSVDFEFNAEAKLIRRAHSAGANSPYVLQLAHDAAGRITGKTETLAGVAKSFDYRYDDDGQLIEVREDDSIVEQYAYDVNGNRTLRAVRGSTEVAAFDSQDRITGQGAVAYVLNEDGFLTQRGQVAFAYSARGELLSADVPGTGTITYAYDAFNRQIGRAGPDGTTEYLYGDPNNPVIVTDVRDPDGTLTRYSYDSAGILFAFQRAADTYYVASDQVGSPRVVFDADGVIVKTIEYDAFGVVLADSDPGFRLHIGYAGGITDPDTGLIRFGLRDYDPASGRWTARDPLLYQGGQANLYAYVNNNPISFRDPTGLICIGGSAYKLFGGGATFCFDTQGTSLCLEVGLEVSTNKKGSGGFKLDLDGNMANTDGGGSSYTELGATVKCGPVSVGGKLKLDACGSLTFNCPVSIGGFGLSPCAGMQYGSDGWTGPTKEKVTGSMKTPGLKDLLGKLKDYSPPPVYAPVGTRVADPQCEASASIKGGVCGRHKW